MESDHEEEFHRMFGADNSPTKASIMASMSVENAKQPAPSLLPTSAAQQDIDLGVSIGLQSILQPYPIDVRQTKNRGKIVIATRDLLPGEIVLRSMHYMTTVSDEFKGRVCSFCSRHAPKRLNTKCPRCKEVAYCNPECQQLAEHSEEECAALRHLRSGPEEFSNDQLSEMRMVLRMICKRALELKTGQHQHDKLISRLGPSEAHIHPPTFADIVRLVPNGQNFRPETQEEVRRMTRHLMYMLNAPPPNSMSTTTTTIAAASSASTAPATACGLRADEIMDLFYREKCNCFGIWDMKDQCLASAVFPLASFFNHSCIPNCSRYPDLNGLLSIRTMHAIPAGSELTISYITLKNANSDWRHEHLSTFYCFDCRCPRCRDQTTVSDLFVANFLCPREVCTGLMVPTDGPNCMTRRCRICGYTQPLPSHFWSELKVPYNAKTDVSRV